MKNKREQKQNMKRMILTLVVCFILVFSIVVSETSQSSAFVPVLFVNDQVIMASVLSAMGYEVTDEGFAEFCQYAYDSLSISQKAMIAEKALAVAYIGKGIGEIEFTQSEWNGIIDWYNLNSSWMNSTISYGISIPSIINDYVWSGTKNINAAMQTIYNSATNDKIITYNQAGTNYYQNFECFTGDFKLRLTSSGTVSLSAESGTSITHYSYSGTTLYTETISGITGTLKLVLYSGVFNLLNSSNQPIGIMNTGTSTLLQQMSLFNPNTHPLKSLIDGSYTLHVPVAEIPQTGIDEGINMPDTSADHPISLQQVIDWYGSLQNFFDAGNVINLADGTTLSGTNEYTRGVSTDTLPDVTTGTDTAADVGLIGNIVSHISESIDSIRDFVIDFTDTSSDPTSWDNKNKTPGNGIKSLFPNLLALLIAIMHLIAKVVVFIGQLWSIPASSAMIHPTMIQGITWARGFTSQTGVNLYSLITGIISVVFGIVCFKLLKSIITGVGSASYTDNQPIELMSMADPKFRR